MTRSDRERLVELRAQVEGLNRANRQQGHAAWCGRDYDYVCPAVGTCPFQWFWDSCFHAIVLSHFDIERAEAELQTLLISQQPDGFIPHVTYWTAEPGKAHRGREPGAGGAVRLPRALRRGVRGGLRGEGLRMVGPRARPARG